MHSFLQPVTPRDDDSLTHSPNNGHGTVDCSLCQTLPNFATALFCTHSFRFRCCFVCAVLTLFLRYFLLELYYALLLILHTLRLRISLFSFLTDCVVQDDDEDVVESLISPLSVCLSDDDAGWLADSAVALLAESALRGRCV